MNPLYAELHWLPRPPPDFAAQVAELRNALGPIGRPLQSLASSALNLNQLTRLIPLHLIIAIRRGLISELTVASVVRVPRRLFSVTVIAFVIHLRPKGSGGI